MKYNNEHINTQIIRELLYCKVLICGIYNVLREYDTALSVAAEARSLLTQLSEYDNAYFCNQGLIAMEEGHSYLRKNQLLLANKRLSEACGIFHKAKIGDYLTRLLMQYTETLIRLGEFEQAYNYCQEVLNTKSPDNNIINRLFYNTAIYNVVVIKYKQKDFVSSAKYFKQFFEKMNGFCKDYLSQKQYDLLFHENRFKDGNLKQCFENSLKIFEEVCVNGSEFISDYVKKNYEEV